LGSKEAIDDELLRSQGILDGGKARENEGAIK
jgi:hypothetical protein